MNIRNLYRTILLMALSFLHTSFASDVDKVTENQLTSRLPYSPQWDEKHPINQTITLVNEKNNDSTCKSLYMGIHTKYRYLRDNYLLIPAFFVSQCLAYCAFWPAEVDSFRFCGGEYLFCHSDGRPVLFRELNALMPLMLASCCIFAVYCLAEMFLADKPSCWASQKENEDRQYRRAMYRASILNRNFTL